MTEHVKIIIEIIKAHAPSEADRNMVDLTLQHMKEPSLKSVTAILYMGLSGSWPWSTE